MKFDIRRFLKNFELDFNFIKIWQDCTVIVHKDLFRFMNQSSLFLLRMIKFSDKIK